MLKESLIENHSIALNQTATSWQEANRHRLTR